MSSSGSRPAASGSFRLSSELAGCALIVALVTVEALQEVREVVEDIVN
jgi:hypothetical protein